MRRVWKAFHHIKLGLPETPFARRGRCSVENLTLKQTCNPQPQIEVKTAALIFEAAKALFRWCKSEQGYVRINPAKDIRITAPLATRTCFECFPSSLATHTCT